MKKYVLDKQEANLLLDEILERCGINKNNVPLDTLLSYSYYRKERYAVQKRITAFILFIFILLPFLFITCSTQLYHKESQYLKLYELEVHTPMPIRSITATIKDEKMPIYENEDGNYVIKAIDNGTMVIKVELYNHQIEYRLVEVEGSDNTTPVILDQKISNDSITLHVQDLDSGINYNNSYAHTKDNQLNFMSSYNESSGLIVFNNVSNIEDIVIKDKAGNKTTININS